MKKMRNLLALSVTLLVTLGGPTLAQDVGTLDKDHVVNQAEPYSPYVDQHFPQKVLWGDTHHHTSYSVDSGMIGNNNSPEVSFRLARGEEVTSNGGQRVKLIRPLRHCQASQRGKPRPAGNRRRQGVVRGHERESAGSLASRRFHAERLHFRRTAIQ
jgi:hypothetical protein